MSFGKRVAAEREARGWSQNHLAKLAGLNPPTLNRIERRDNDDVELAIAIRIARALEKPLDELTVDAQEAARRPEAPAAGRESPSRDPWTAIEALQEASKKTNAEVRRLRALVEPRRKQNPKERRSA